MTESQPALFDTPIKQPPASPKILRIMLKLFFDDQRWALEQFEKKINVFIDRYEASLNVEEDG